MGRLDVTVRSRHADTGWAVDACGFFSHCSALTQLGPVPKNYLNSNWSVAAQTHVF